MVAISFFLKNSLFLRLNHLVTGYFGWGAVLLPIWLVALGLVPLNRRRSHQTSTHLALGGTILLLTLISLSASFKPVHSGTIGREVWLNASQFLSSAGAILILLAIGSFGVIVFFNTSFDEVWEVSCGWFGALRQFGQRFLPKGLIAHLQKVWLGSRGRPSVSEPRQSLRISQGPPASEVSDQSLRPQDKAVGSKPELESRLIQNLPGRKGIWQPPPYNLLDENGGKPADRGDIKQNAEVIERTLDSFGITARVNEVNLGPAVTQYALEIAMGTKLSKITALSNDLALALAAPTGQIRIEAPIPGRSLVGVEIPNRSLELVTLKRILTSEKMKKTSSRLSFGLGLDVSGTPLVADLDRMPHLLIAGATGSGKSVCINAIVCSYLFRASPQEIRLILVDPKRVEMVAYNGIPHLMTPVIVDIDQTLSALKWAIGEMDRRYKLFASVGVRNINAYNEASGFQALPYLIILIDELADLMAFAPAEFEDSITRLAQMSRATGIHLILATQRPSIEVITGLIKANIPARMAFAVSSQVDSRVILDTPGAEKLLGRGDMLFLPPDQAKPSRIQGTYVSDQEINRVVVYLKQASGPVEYAAEVTEKYAGAVSSTLTPLGNLTEKDAFFEEAAKIVCRADKASSSLLQRRLKIGYARAARILDQLEANGIVGPADGSKPREVLTRDLTQALSNPDDFSGAAS